MLVDGWHVTGDFTVDLPCSCGVLTNDQKYFTLWAVCELVSNVGVCCTQLVVRLSDTGKEINSNDDDDDDDSDDGGDDEDDSDADGDDGGDGRRSQVDELEDLKGQRSREIDNLGKQLSDALSLLEEEKERCGKSPQAFDSCFLFFCSGGGGWW